MNTNPMAKTVLCFGDSNTWGQTPDKSRRYSANERWTRQLQDMLGSDYYVIEEGLGGRVTNFDPDGRNDRNGKTYLLQAVPSHSPLDYFVIMLGTNDMKYRFERSANDVAEAVAELVDMAVEYQKGGDNQSMKVVVVAPVHIDHEAEWFSDMYPNDFDESSTTESKELAPILNDLSKKNGWIFVEAAKYSKVGKDGLHFSQGVSSFFGPTFKMFELVPLPTITVRSLQPGRIQKQHSVQLYTSLIHTGQASVAGTRTVTDWCVTISRKELTSSSSQTKNYVK